MGKTIIQSIGPLYGDVVNGTVFGRPNGSVYVPSQNVISADLGDSYLYIKNYSSYYAICNSGGSVAWSNGVHVVAESQDIQNYIEFQVATDSDFSTIIGTVDRVAGAFNVTTWAISQGSTLSAIEDETTYYFRAVLMSLSGVPVATSDTFELTGVASE